MAEEQVNPAPIAVPMNPAAIALYQSEKADWLEAKYFQAIVKMLETQNTIQLLSQTIEQRDGEILKMDQALADASAMIEKLKLDIIDLKAKDQAE